MPKIIENLRARLTEEARRQAGASGYSAVTIRSVAAVCGVGVGTVYNYFPSKDELLAAFMLEDWQRCIATITDAGHTAEDPVTVVSCIHHQLRTYLELHKSIFQDEAAAAAFRSSFSKYHGLLRGQLAAPLRRFCPDDFAAEFIAESLLTWTVNGKEFDEILPLLQKLFL